MTTLTPEKEAELRDLIPCGKEGGCILDYDDGRCSDVHDMCLFAKIVSIAERKLSTERQAREAAEAERDHLGESMRMYARYSTLHLERAEAAEARLAALSALPPPVPAEEGGEPRKALKDMTASELQHMEDKALYEAMRDAQRALEGGSPAGRYTWLDAPVDILKARAEASPTQAPQDVAGLVEGDIALLRRLLKGQQEAGHCGEGTMDRKDREAWNDRVARIDRILSALRASPISHEDRPLELAAADNNHKALVDGWQEVETAPRISREPFLAWDGDCQFAAYWNSGEWYGYGLVGVVNFTHWRPLPAPPQQAASAAATNKASGQSRQEGKQP